MEIKIRVVTKDADYVVGTTLFHIVLLERAYKTTASQLQGGISIEQLGFLAHEASKTGGHKPPPALDDFLRSLTDLSVVSEEEEELPPTGTAP